MDRLFDRCIRTDGSVAAHAEPKYAFLNRAKGEFWDDVRWMLEEWFSRMASDNRRDLHSRLRSKDDRDFDAAFWELYLHESMRVSGYTVTCHPDVAGPRRPDFLVDTGQGRFYMEARSVGQSQAVHAERKRLALVYDAINGLECPGHLLRIEVESVGPANVSLRKLKAEVQRWVDQLPADDAHPDNPDPWERDPWEWRDAGWSFRLWARPRSMFESGSVIPTLAMMGSAQGSLIDDERPLRKALSEKGKSYGHLPDPFVVALRVDTLGDDRFAIMNTLYGRWQVQFWTDPSGQTATKDVRAPDGYWYGGNQWKHNSVSAVLLGHNIAIWNVTRMTPTCWTHPGPACPLNPPGCWETATPRPDGQLEFIGPTVKPHQLFGLPENWLSGDPFADENH